MRRAGAERSEYRFRDRDERKVKRNSRKTPWMASVIRWVCLRREVLRTARVLAAFWKVKGRLALGDY